MSRKQHHVSLGIAEGDIVVPVHAWEQASVVHRGAARLNIHERYCVASVRAVYNGAFVTLREKPGEEFPAHLFERPPEVAFALRAA